MSEPEHDPLAEFAASRAKREAGPITAAFLGISGSGKTLSALRFARGLVGPTGKIIIADTEGKRSLIYADDPEVKGFEHIDFRPPYSSERFRLMVKAAIAQGTNALVIDSASHEHEAEGGLLEFADSEERRLGAAKRVSQQKWIRPKIAHNHFIRAAVSAPFHVIFCLRLKRIVDINVTPAKEIFVPVMDAALFYDMMIAIEVQDKGHAHYLKVPEPFVKHIEEGALITVEHGRMLLEEASRGVAEDPLVTKQRAALEDLARDSGTEALKTAWAAIAKTQVAKALQSELSRLKMLASETDARLAAEEAARSPSETERAAGNLLQEFD